MDIGLNVSLHNHFRIEVVNKDTGEVVQTAKAENMVTDLGKKAYFRALFGKQSPTSMPQGIWGYMHVGSGTGTFTPDMKTMLKFEKQYATGSVKNTLDHTADRIQYQKDRYIMINYNELVGVDLTEVGFYFNKHEYDTYDPSITAGLATHAFITDAEGNPISIRKTDTDVIYIYATLYFVVSHNAGPNMAFVKAWQLITYAFDNSSYSNGLLGKLYTIKIGDSNTPPSVDDTGLKGNQIGVATSYETNVAESVFDLEQRKLTIKFRWDTAAVGKVKEIWIAALISSGSRWYDYSSYNLARIVLPIGSWTEHVETDQVLGTGDGTTLTFKLPSTAFPVKDGTLVVKIGGTETNAYTYDNATGIITMQSAPGAGAAVSASYKNAFIPKHQYNLMDLTVTFTFSSFA